jgi:hypothetical protein
MKTRTAATNTNPKLGRGPSLYGVETPGKDPLEGLSILGALEPGRSRARAGRRGLLALLTALLLLPATYLVATSSVLRQSIPLLALATPGFEAGSAKERAASSASASPTATAPPPVAEAASAATITTEPFADKPAPQEAPAASYPETGLSLAQLAAVVAPKTEYAPEPAKASAVTVASARPTQTPRRKETKDLTLAATARAKRTDAGRQAVAQAHASANTARDSKNKEKDKDVDLIAALLTHISRPGAANKDATPKPSRTSTPSLTLAVSASKREDRASNRDIVVQTAGESRESLLSRCRSLGLLEGELCRIRICSGSWGTDPACSMDAAVRGD